MDKICADNLNDIDWNNNSSMFEKDIILHMKIEKVGSNPFLVLTRFQTIMYLIFSTDFLRFFHNF